MEIGDRTSVAAAEPQSDAQPRDRCEYQRPFQPGFADCPTFQARPFVALTSFGKSLGTHLSCRHLIAGERDQNRFYARCGLGTETERLRWLAATGPGTVEVVRALQADFEESAARYRTQLIEAKVRVMQERPSGSRQAVDTLSQLIDEFLSEADAFLSANAQRLNEVGLSPAALRKLLAGVLRTWAGSRTVDLPQLGERNLLNFTPEVRSFLGSIRQGDLAAARGTVPHDLPVSRSPSLLITQRSDPPELVFTGQIGLAEVDLVSTALANGLEGRRELHIDIAGVTFCSLEGLRLLVRAADDHTICLQGTPPHVARALHAAGWSRVPNLFWTESTNVENEDAR